MTFLSVYTPTYKRPQALARCKASVAAQTIPTEHVIIVDEIMEPRGGHDDFV